MILQNNNGENKIFIDENLNGVGSAVIRGIPEEPGTVEILLDQEEMTVYLDQEGIIIHDVNKIIYDEGLDYLSFILKSGYVSCMKKVKENEIVSVSKSGDEEKLIVTTINLPMFLFEDNYDEKYPKFEVNLSDCVYNMKIYINDSEYIAIPDFQSHYNIHSTLDYITQLLYYLEEWRPKFIHYLCSDNHMALMITNKENEKINCGIMEYKLGEEGLFLTGGELENYLVKWQEFFKLIMDGKWEVSFKDE